MRHKPRVDHQPIECCLYPSAQLEVTIAACDIASPCALASSSGDLLKKQRSTALFTIEVNQTEYGHEIDVWAALRRRQRVWMHVHDCEVSEHLTKSRDALTALCDRRNVPKIMIVRHAKNPETDGANGIRYRRHGDLPGVGIRRWRKRQCKSHVANPVWVCINIVTWRIGIDDPAVVKLTVAPEDKPKTSTVKSIEFPRALQLGRNRQLSNPALGGKLPLDR